MASEPVLLLAEKNSSRFVVFHDLREEPNGFGLVFHDMKLGPPPAERNSQAMFSFNTAGALVVITV